MSPLVPLTRAVVVGWQERLLHSKSFTRHVITLKVWALFASSPSQLRCPHACDGPFLFFCPDSCRDRLSSAEAALRSGM